MSERGLTYAPSFGERGEKVWMNDVVKRKVLGPNQPKHAVKLQSLMLSSKREYGETCCRNPNYSILFFVEIFLDQDFLHMVHKKPSVSDSNGIAILNQYLVQTFRA